MTIIYFDELNSTNTYVKENIDKLSDKSLIVAHSQTKGRGRFDRVWVDFGKKNVFMTFVLKPSEKIEQVYANLTQYLSVCICKELETFGLQPEIKWPNDIQIDGKKIAGILAESVIKNGILKGIALGVGLNIDAPTSSLKTLDRPASALNLEGVFVEKEKIIESVYYRFFKSYQTFLSQGFTFIQKDYEKYAIKYENCTISVFKTTESGSFKGFNSKGELLLEVSGTTKNYNMGEII